MILITDEIFNRLSEGLDGIDKIKIRDLINKFGLYEAGRILGYDVSHYNNLLMSGRLAIEDLKNRGPKNLLEYVDVMKNRLSKDTYWYIVENYRKLQDAIDRNSFKDYDHDWFSGNTMITMYSSPVVFRGQGIETPQQIWMRVAIQLYHDESVEEVIKAYEDMASGWYTPASPTIFNAGMEGANLSSCFIAGTEVCTSEGNKPIEEIKVGDIVITHTGSAKKVLQLHKNSLGTRQLYDLKCWKTPSVTVTGNHKVVAIEKGKSACWTPIDQLTKEHYVAIPCRNSNITDPKILTFDLSIYLEKFQRTDHVRYEYDITEDTIHTTSISNINNACGQVTTRTKHSPVKRYFTITHDVAMAIGMWYGDGSIITKKNVFGGQYNRGLSVVSHENNQKILDFWIKTMTTATGVDVKLNKEKNNLVYANLHSAVMGEVFNELFGKGFSSKRLHSSMFSWDASLVKSFMIGLMSTDGCITKDGTMTIGLSNPPLVKQLYHMCRQIGKDVSYNIDNKLKKGGTVLTATINLPKGWIQPSELCKYYDDDRLSKIHKKSTHHSRYQDSFGRIYVKVKSLEKSNIDRPEYVYTLGVEDDHSYNVEGLVVENCFLLSIGDNLESILKNGSYRAGLISKVGGGLGFNISNVRHSEIRDIGCSDGIIPMLQVYNDVVRYVNQLGRRKGAATVFLRPHHLDIEDFVDLPLKVGERYVRAHDINTCLWTSWIFWERVITDDKWTLFCPAKVPELNNLYGQEFTKAYIAAENNPSIADRHKKVISARGLYDRIRKVQLETGMPYLMDGDGSNLKSNQRHLGYIGGSNLCLEIIEYTDEDNIASCNLHSLSLRMFAREPINKLIEPKLAITQCVDFQQLSKIVHNVTRNLNKIIDHTFYPLDKVKDGKLKAGIINKTNNKHRPIAMGASGFAEMLHIVDLPFETQTTKLLNEMVFACIYWNALAASVQLAVKDGPYESFKGSPTSFGKLQFDLWKEEFDILGPNSARRKEDDDPLDPITWNQQRFILCDKNDKVIDTILPTWEDLKRCILKYGLRNSLLVALMPTASTAQIRRNCESVEAHQNNLYSRKVMKYSYPVLNRYLVEDFIKEGVWNNNVVEYIKVKNGSIQGVTNYISNNRHLFPNYSGKEERIAFLELKYKTQWEISQKWMLELAAKRARYVDQSMSTNIYLRDCTQGKLMACHLYASKLGLKTLMYYLRQKGGETIKFTADPSMMKHIQNIRVETLKEKQDLAGRQLLLNSGVIEDNKHTSPNISPEKRKYKIKCADNSCCT